MVSLTTVSARHRWAAHSFVELRARLHRILIDSGNLFIFPLLLSLRSGWSLGANVLREIELPQECAPIYSASAGMTTRGCLPLILIFPSNSGGAGGNGSGLSNRPDSILAQYPLAGTGMRVR